MMEIFCFDDVMVIVEFDVLVFVVFVEVEGWKFVVWMGVGVFVVFVVVLVVVVCWYFM